MAIGPQLLKTSLKREAQKFEEKIDEVLRTRKLYGNSVTVIAPEGMTSAHLDIIKQGYLNAGWTTVKWESNQHDGASITFDCTERVYNQWDR